MTQIPETKSVWNERSLSKGFWIGGFLGMVFFVSLFSGFQSVKLPFELLWQFTPLGLLTHFDPEFFNLPCQSGFRGVWGYHWDYAKTFLLTCTFESLFYLYLFRQRGWLSGLYALLLCNLLTHPAVFFIFPAMFNHYLPMALSAEVFAPAAEIAACLFLIRKESIQISILRLACVITLANLFSWQMGAFL